MEKEGSKRIQIVGIDDKRQLTAVFTGSLAGDFLAPQLIYQGKSPRSLPLIRFPNDWHVTFSPNHGSNEETMRCYIQKIIIPYIVKKREELKLATTHPVLVVFDNISGQCTGDLFQILDDNVINFLIVPANCTDRLQPLDLSVKKAATNFLLDQLQDWYAHQISSAVQNNTEMKPVDLKLSIVKPLGAQ